MNERKAFLSSTREETQHQEQKSICYFSSTFGKLLVGATANCKRESIIVGLLFKHSIRTSDRRIGR